MIIKIKLFELMKFSSVLFLLWTFMRSGSLFVSRLRSYNNSLLYLYFVWHIKTTNRNIHRSFLISLLLFFCLLLVNVWHFFKCDWINIHYRVVGWFKEKINNILPFPTEDYFIFLIDINRHISQQQTGFIVPYQVTLFSLFT